MNNYMFLLILISVGLGLIIHTWRKDAKEQKEWRNRNDRAPEISKEHPHRDFNKTEIILITLGVGFIIILIFIIFSIK